MLRRGCTAVAIAGCLLGGGAAAAQADSVTGDGAIDLFGSFRTQLTIDASSGANGESPSGEARGEGRFGGAPFDVGDALFSGAPSVPFSSPARSPA